MNTNNSIIKHFFQLFICLACCCIFSATAIAAKKPLLKDIQYIALPNNQVRITLMFNQPVKNIKKKHFYIKKPPQLIYDFENTSSAVGQTEKLVELGSIIRASTVEDSHRTRVILTLRDNVKFSASSKDTQLNITLSGIKVSTKKSLQQRFHNPTPKNTRHKVTSIDFRSARNNGGKLVVEVSDKTVGFDIQRLGDNIFVNLLNTQLPKKLRHRLDVTDFGTPVQTISTGIRNKNTRIKIHSKGGFEHFAYQINKQFIVEVLPISAERKAKEKRRKPVYKGKRISLNFQDIKVRSVLQLLAEFTSLNIVVSDTVRGNITLRLNNVPWDQAMAIILKTRGLDKRRYGSVILVAPASEIAQQEKQELQAKKEVKQLIPLTSELLQVNYAKASEIAGLLKDKDNSLLSKRGHVSVDQRTNTLWIQDSSDKLEEIRGLIHKLDIPVKQVLIESRVVTVDKDFEREIGVRFGITNNSHVSGTLKGANEIAGGTAPADVNLLDRLNVSLPVDTPAGRAGTIGIALAKLSKNVFLDLELSALESEGRGEIIASPRLITANQQAARIESGEEIPFQQATSSGATAIAFKKAVLSLEVTPQITPDHKIILTLKVNQDRASTKEFNGVPAIITKEIQTKVLVDNGQTIVLGGIYQQNKNLDVTRVPFLGTLPFIGALFRNKAIRDKREELLIFVTPKIIEQGFSEG